MLFARVSIETFFLVMCIETSKRVYYAVNSEVVGIVGQGELGPRLRMAMGRVL